MNSGLPYTLKAPERQSVPFVFASPHSGTGVPESMMEASRLSRQELRRAEDCYVDELYADIPEFGAPLLAANWSRTCVDLNRSASELDPDLFSPRLKTRGLEISDKVKGGLGVIPRIVAVGQPIYRAPLPAEEAASRIEHIHKPYHEALDQLLNETHARFGRAVLIDCHSMPSGPTGFRKRMNRLSRDLVPDVVIGDRWGTTANALLVNELVSLFKGEGFTVARNKPYAGGWCTRTHGDPDNGRHAIQIELSRALYMDERTFEKNGDFEALHQKLASIMKRFVGFYQEQSQAAE